jgi:formylglycine-generating enzyme required for sulfatase activity
MSFDNERQRHEVYLDALEMARVPVRQRDYEAVMGTNPSSIKGEELSVIFVGWKDAIRFCNAISESDGLKHAYHEEGDAVVWDRSANGYRPPTEAEWEYAARGMDGRIYPWGMESPSNLSPRPHRLENSRDLAAVLSLQARWAAASRVACGERRRPAAAPP